MFLFQPSNPGTLVLVSNSFTLANNQVAAASVTNLIFNKTSLSYVIVAIAGRRRTDSGEYVGGGFLSARYAKDANTWSIDYDLSGDRESNLWLGLTFSITSAGQVQYTSSNIAGANYAGYLRFDILKSFVSFAT